MEDLFIKKLKNIFTEILKFFLIYKYVKTTFCDVMYRFPLQQPHRRLLQTHR